MYQFRGLPCTREIKDVDGLSWVIGGTWEEDGYQHSGILEWCHDVKDAYEVYRKMLDYKYTHLPFDAEASFQVGLERPTKPNVSPGDIVVAYFYHCNEYCRGTVYQVDIRYAMGNLVHVKDVTSIRCDGEKLHTPKHFDANFIVAVIGNTGIGYPKYNHLRNFYGTRAVPITSARLNININSILIGELSKLPFRIPTDISDYAYSYYKSCGKPGCTYVRVDDHLIPKYNLKVIRRWVRKNWSRLIMTVKDNTKAAKAELEMYDKMMEEDLKDMLEEDWLNDPSWNNMSEEMSDGKTLGELGVVGV